MAALNCISLVSGTSLRSRNSCADGSDALMHHQFRGDQQGYCHKKADVDLQVQQEGYGRHTFRQVPFKTRKHQEGKPCEQ